MYVLLSILLFEPHSARMQAPPTGDENSLASADASALLADDDDEAPVLSAQDQAFQPVASLPGSLFSHNSATTTSFDVGPAPSVVACGT